ncbi:MAG: sulfatase-like hydrolase/transferase [Planctomycetota bacterium]
MSRNTGKPNVLFIISDQHRHNYMACAGADFIRTPNMDRIAARGVRFTQCTTNCPVCAPARIGLATGLQPFRLGSLGNDSYLPRSAATYYQRLRDHGYRVGCVGKLDLAKPDHYNGRYGDRPCVFGWGFTHPEECEGKMHAGTSPTPIGPYTYWLEERGLLKKFHEDYEARRVKGYFMACHDSVLPTEAFEDAYIGRRAAEWIENAPDDFPWHYFVSFVGPHDPFDPPTEYGDRYRNAAMPKAITDDCRGKPQWIRNRTKAFDQKDVAVTRRQYCGAIELIDDHIGMILDALERRGMAENTYIIYSSDHGEMLGDHGLYTKSVPYEAALRIPLIVAGPGIEAGRVSDALVEWIDLNPTICELAGLPAQENIDALSIVPVLHGEATEHRTEAISRIAHFALIRTRRHKLVQHVNDTPELYDLEADPDELRNIAPEGGDMKSDLRSRLHARLLEGQWRR